MTLLLLTEEVETVESVVAGSRVDSVVAGDGVDSVVAGGGVDSTPSWSQELASGTVLLLMVKSVK